MSSDAVPILVGAVIAIVLIKWLFRSIIRLDKVFFLILALEHKDDPRGAGGPPREVLEQLTTMFPNIPPSVLRAELVRAGSMGGAIERLLAISPQYQHVQSPAQTDKHSPPKSKLAELIRELDETNSSASKSEMAKIDAETWTKDRSIREQLLLQKKREMLLKARQ